MSPIKGISDQTVLPRLGKIRLGIKVNAKCPKCGWEEFAEQDEPNCPLCATMLQFKKRAYPRATPYFVVPEDIQPLVGEKPTELDIMFPLNDINQFAPHWLSRWSQTQGRVCRGDEETCRRKVDTATGAMASHETPEGRWVYKEPLDCNPQECPEFTTKRCRQLMNLMVLLPNVPGGLGVWQIDTSSWHSIKNILSMAKALIALTGRCSFIPLKLKLGPQEVSPPGSRKKTVHIMHVENYHSLAQLALMGQKTPAQVLLPEPDMTEVAATFFADAEEVEEAEVPPAEEPPTQVPVAGGIDLIEEEVNKEFEGLPRPPQGEREPKLTFSSFWARCRELGLSPAKVEALLKKSPRDWIKGGGTLEEALEIIEKAPKQEGLL